VAACCEQAVNFEVLWKMESSSSTVELPALYMGPAAWSYLCLVLPKGLLSSGYCG